MTPSWPSYFPGGIPAIVGPTGSGKSTLAESLAQSDPRWRLINADPFQAYRGLDIGTAKPESTRRTLYAMMDTVEPTVALDAMTYAGQMRAEIYAVLKSGRWPLLVGGSGFYLDALEHPHDPEPTLSDADLQALRARIKLEASAVLAEIPAQPGAHTPLAVNDHYRIEKAWVRAYGCPADPATKPQAVALRYYGLWAEGDSYESTLHSRLAAMYAAGWADEARRLVTHFGAEAPALRAIGYRELATGSGKPDSTVRQRILAATRQYAKRQRTWFRAKPVRWFPAHSDGCSNPAIRARGAQNLTLRLIQYTDVCDAILR